MGRPDEIARAVPFLTPKEAEHITGETLEVDRGALGGHYHLPPSR
jgi:NAD(P)-dependent dehydrogenase (short-subunit alcohol dehydrogenase family)